MKNGKAIKDRFQISQYLFGTFPLPYDEQTELLLFINIEETLRTILNHYEDFRRVLGHDFDPFKAVFDVANKNSEFWNVVINSHALQGILLGFGRDNAWFFEWDLQHEKEQDSAGKFLNTLGSDFAEDLNLDESTPQHFPLPIFRSYGLHPNLKLIEQYKQQRVQIKSLYKDRDEVDVAIEWLTREGHRE